ncbi:MAG: NUDIX domain-containing protein [Candidatus Pacebacteria bacterium]|nr:NUDIX domain-containing protein [Candidatus Paceibacterota bacterium]
MKQLVNKISISHPFGNILRPEHVLLVVQDYQDNFILGGKPNFYPENIYRFVGGGVEVGETPLQAAIREAEEELDLKLGQTQLEPLVQVKTIASCRDQEYQNSTTLYYLDLELGMTLKPGGDITFLKTMTRSELDQLCQRFDCLSASDWLNGKDGYKHCWADYGKMYGFIHRCVL